MSQNATYLEAIEYISYGKTKQGINKMLLNMSTRRCSMTLGILDYIHLRLMIESNKRQPRERYIRQGKRLRNSLERCFKNMSPRFNGKNK